MNFIFIEIAKNNLREVFRNFKSNGIVFVLPVIFIGIFGFIFNQTSNVVFDAALIKDDKENLAELIGVLDTLKNESDEELFKFNEYDNLDDARDSVRIRKNDLVITFDQGKVKIIRDSSAPISAAAEALIKDIVDTREDLITSEDIVAQEEFTAFQRLVPGLLVYGLLVLIPQVASALAVLKERNYVFRLFTSKIKARDVILGFLVSQSVVAILQTILLFTTATLFGFKFSGEILTAFVFVIPTNIFVVGIGLILGSLTSSAESAGNLGSMVSVILGFLSGSFFVGIENIKLFGSNIAIVDYVPTFYATEGMRNILLFSKDLNSEAKNLFAVSISGAIFLIIGILVYQYKRMSKLG